jgi:hypothetical protein
MGLARNPSSSSQPIELTILQVGYARLLHPYILRVANQTVVVDSHIHLLLTPVSPISNGQPAQQKKCALIALGPLIP